MMLTAEEDASDVCQYTRITDGFLELLINYENDQGLVSGVPETSFESFRVCMLVR